MILEKLVEILPDMDFCGVDENVFKFYGTYEEDFSYTFTISTLAKGKYLVVINLYTNTRFPVREFRVRVDNLESILEEVMREQVDKSLGYVCSDGSIVTWVDESYD